MDRDKLTNHLQADEKELGILMIDVAELAWKTNRAQNTNFLDPYEQRIAKSVLSAMPEVNTLTFGGYKQAERARLAVYPQFYLTETIESPLRVIAVSGNFNFAKVAHRDFLGSILGLGIKREKVGDLIVTSSGCQVIVASEIADYILIHWDKVHQVPISVEEIDQEQLAIKPERIKEIKCTVASMRLDTIAASGYGTSRTKMARDIKGDRVKVNWKATTNPATEIAEGDVISIRGRGRVIVDQINGTTKKGRTGLVLKRLM